MGFLSYTMVREDKSTWKANYFTRLADLLEEFPKCFIVGADNVGSKQMQEIRIALRGKNTMMRKVIRGQLDKNPDLEKLLPHVKMNVGFVFTKMELTEIRDLLLANKKEAPAKAGAIAPIDVTIPAQNTGMGPEKTSFFQALSIPTKITKGTIEIIQDVPIIKVGDKVGASEATLLNMLKIFPFHYGLIVQKVYDQGSVFSPEILDITDDDIKNKFMARVANVAAVCLEIGYPTIASAPHSIANGMKNLLAIAAVTDITFKEAEMLKEFLADPSILLLQLLPLLPRLLLQLPLQRLRKKRRKRMMTWDSVFLTRTFQLNHCIIVILCQTHGVMVNLQPP